MQGIQVLLFSLALNTLITLTVVAPVCRRSVISRKTVDYYFFGPFSTYAAAGVTLLLHSLTLWSQFGMREPVALFAAFLPVLISALLLPLSFTLVYSTFLAWLIAFHRPERWSKEKLVFAGGSANGKYPSVSIIIPSRNEPFAVAKMTFDSALQVRYPAEALTVIVVDNSDVSHPDYAQWREYVESWNGVQGRPATRFIHRDGIVGFKAGNMDLGLQATESEYVLFLDVDSTLTAECLVRGIPEFRHDPNLAFVHFNLVGTNKSTSPLAGPMAWSLGITRYKECMRGAHGGWSLFVGHNSIWRTRFMKAMGTCIDTYQGKDIVVEDASLTIRAQLRGYYGKYIWHTTGEWVPGSLKDIESMWARWTYGTCQVILKYRRLHFCSAKNNLTLPERTDILHHGCNYLAVGLLPLWIILPFLAQNAAGMIGLFMNLLVLAPLLGHCIGYCFNRSFRRQFSAQPRHAEFLIGMFLIEPFITWVKFKAIWRFVWRLPQGWRPTGKTGIETGSWKDVVWKWKDLLLFCLIVISWFVVDMVMHFNLGVALTRIPALLLCIGMLLSIFCYGKAKIVHPENLETATTINALLSRRSAKPGAGRIGEGDFTWRKRFAAAVMALFPVPVAHPLPESSSGDIRPDGDY